MTDSTWPFSLTTCKNIWTRKSAGGGRGNGWPVAEKSAGPQSGVLRPATVRRREERKSDREQLSSHFRLLPLETERALPLGHSITVNASSNLVDINQIVRTP